VSGGFGSAARLDTPAGTVQYFRLSRLADLGLFELDRMPYSLRVLLEGALRHAEQHRGADSGVAALVQPGETPVEIAFRPRRVLHQDFTGGAAMVDLAAMRAALQRLGSDPQRINPVVPTDFVIDHSVQAEFSGTADAFDQNVELEIAQNRERYLFLRWAQEAFQNFRLVPPGTGIIHQVNLEHLATVVQVTRTADGQWLATPDSLVGTDSHTTMVNGLGVVGWGVGGIEAEAVMLGRPLYLLVPEVVGVRLDGQLRPGVTATDLVLTITALLRAHGVVGKFVEFCGPGVDRLTLADRATVANMAPEYGASMGFFPIDNETLGYLQATGRDPRHVDLVERYSKAQGLFRTQQAPLPAFAQLLDFDLASVETSLAGPRRPHDRLPLGKVQQSFTAALAAHSSQRGAPRRVAIPADGNSMELADGAVVIAAITSCTNTSNPALMVGAGLLARKAVERGIHVPRYVKTSLAPGSAVVADYLAQAGLMPYLEALGFNVVGFGCTTCAGGSGSLFAPVAAGVSEHDLLVAAILSGNRNFEGRIHPQCRLAYLCSPPLVVAYALAGTVDIDLERDALGTDATGSPVFLRDVWPTDDEVQQSLSTVLEPELFKARYARVFDGDSRWRGLAPMVGPLFQWDPKSTYIREPGYFHSLEAVPPRFIDVRGARALVVLGDSVSTDHISPAGDIPRNSPAGRYLTECGVKPGEFNSYGARRGNHEVMVRGTFANIRLRNALVPEKAGGWTRHLPSGEVLPVFDAAERYKADRCPLLILAGRDYGAGSSRDWAAKGPALLGVRAVVAESFERIHRSNLIGMGVLPLQYLPGESRALLGLNGDEFFDVRGLEGAALTPRQRVTVHASTPAGGTRTFEVIARLDSPVEVQYYQHGGILPFVLRQLLGELQMADPATIDASWL
jgi:aconitate hydratase